MSQQNPSVNTSLLRQADSDQSRRRLVWAVIGALPLIAVAIGAELAVLLVTLDYEQSTYLQSAGLAPQAAVQEAGIQSAEQGPQTSVDRGFLIWGVGGWPLLQVVVEAFKLPLAFFAAMAISRMHRRIGHLAVFTVCTVTFFTLQAIGAKFAKDQLAPGVSLLAQASALRETAAANEAELKQLQDSDFYQAERSQIEADIRGTAEKIALKRDAARQEVDYYRQRIDEVAQAYLTADLRAQLESIDLQLRQRTAEHDRDKADLERGVAEAKASAQRALDSWTQQAAEIKAGAGAERADAERRYEAAMTQYRDDLTRYEAARVQHDRELKEMQDREDQELKRVAEEELAIFEATKKKEVQARYAQWRKERSEAFRLITRPTEPQRELLASADLPPSPPPIEQNPFVVEREAALASLLAEQRSERVALGAKRDEIEREARLRNAAKIPQLEAEVAELRAKEQKRLEELRSEIRELELKESGHRERLSAALLDPATRSQRSDELQASITKMRGTAMKAEADGERLISESDPGRLGGFFPFLPRDLTALERANWAQTIALPVLALLIAVAPAFMLELAVSGARRAWFGQDKKGRGSVRGFWVTRRRLSRQLKAAAKERRRLETERAEVGRSLEEERKRLAASIEQLASQKFSELVAQFDGLKNLEEFRDETAKVIRDHRDDIRKLAEKVIELDAARVRP